MIFLIVALAVIIALMAAKIYSLKKAAREISEQTAEKLSQDTNTLIDISSSDRDMRRLASSLNDSLRRLRAEHIRYSRGDAELKTAITNISHDLRTPLTAICGYLDFLKEEEKSPGAEKYLKIIEGRTDALRQLTDELLRYSSAASEEQELKFEDISVNAVLEESILGYQAALQEKGIVPDIDITDVKIVRKADRVALSRIFSNLLNNALKYSDGDLKISMDSDGLIRFSNHAGGLDSLQVARLFNRFYTVECNGQSSGLGLSIARLLVEQMDGKISGEYNCGELHIILSLNEK